MVGRALVCDGGAAALAWIIAAQGFALRELIVSDRLAEPRSLMQELIVAPTQERLPPNLPKSHDIAAVRQFGSLRFDGIGSETT